MTNKREVYLLDPKELNPETIAVTFAKTSRSPESFKEIARELSDEKSAKFHDKWVVGYGHSSVAEHAILHIAVENISRLAVECLESNRLASYTEKSTRYQVIDKESFHIPAEIETSPYRDKYVSTIEHLFSLYHKAIPLIEQALKQEYLSDQNESQKSYQRKVTSHCIDACRYLLPAATLANVGITINARALEHALRKMYSHELIEVRDIGQDITRIAREEVPTLVKYVGSVPYLIESAKHLTDLTRNSNTNIFTQEDDWCKMVALDEQADNHILASAIYRFCNVDYSQSLEIINKLTNEERQQISAILLGNLSEHDIPIRELEYSSYTFDLVMDQGAYFELKRHRMMTQTPQPLTVNLGYETPRVFDNTGLLNEYRIAMDEVIDTYNSIARINPQAAAYVIPNAFNRRVLIRMNYRSAYHLVNLRTRANAHFSIRRIVHRLAECIKFSTPIIGSFLPVCPGETWQDIEMKHFLNK